MRTGDHRPGFLSAFQKNAIEQSNGNITAAARLLGVHPNYLHRLIRNMNLRPLIKKMA